MAALHSRYDAWWLIAREIVRARDEREWRQSDLAHAIGTDQRTVSRDESGREMPLDRLELYAAALNLDPERLNHILAGGDPQAEENPDLKELLDAVARLPFLSGDGRRSLARVAREEWEVRKAKEQNPESVKPPRNPRGGVLSAM